MSFKIGQEVELLRHAIIGVPCQTGVIVNIYDDGTHVVDTHDGSSFPIRLFNENELRAQPFPVGTLVYVLRHDDFEGRVGIIDSRRTYDGEYLVRFENPYRPSRTYKQSELEAV
jgi:hypothetical protein